MYLKGDTVKLKSGDIAEVVDAWGVARNWYKMRSRNGKIVIGMDDKIDSLVRRPSKGKWG